ncbi:MAG: helicase C-terminal domain-containing protein [Spirochaetota bacterium]
MHATERLGLDVIEQMQREISEADGSEVLFVGAIDESGVVCSVDVIARGHLSAVPAPLEGMGHGEVVIHNHPSGQLRPSDADLSIAAELANRGIGSYIVDNEVQRLYAVVEALPPKRRRELDVEELADVLRPGGGAARTLTAFESRSEQVSMLEVVAAGFNGDSHVVCEAGTGVGKSFAYLIPAIQWAADNEERVVISTATITLQHQLVEKDIPAVQRMLGTSVPVVIVKGRGNYLCETRLDEAFREQTELFDSVSDELASIRSWASTTPTGVRSDLPFQVEQDVWSQVNADGDSCAPLRCRNNDCFLVRARREAAEARVLVVNHHLLFSDLNLRILGIGYEATAVLPPFTRLVMDEAHTVERIATSYFSDEFFRYALAKVLRQLYRSQGSRQTGLLVRIADESGDASVQADCITRIQRLEAATVQLDERARELFETSETFRLVDLPADLAQRTVLDPLRAVQSELLQLADRLARALEGIEDTDNPVLIDGRGAVRRLERFASVCRRVIDYRDETDEVVAYGERMKGRHGDSCLRLVCAPLHVGEMMQEAVYEPLRTVVFTSATLSVKKSFDFWKSRTGLDRSERVILEGRFESPFDYAGRVMLGVPTDAPEPGSDSYIPFVAGFVTDLLLLTEGKGLVLFTSYSMLLTVYDAVAPALTEAGIAVLRQGSDDRNRLLTTFREDAGSVLFGTDTFWEGVDAPGMSLEVVIICRLPFGVPTHPVAVSRAEVIQKHGGNPFMELAIPEAVVRFRQGFGRLMRRKTDRGMVICTDPRLIRKRYGVVFTESLPPVQMVSSATKDLLEDIERFYF